MGGAENLVWSCQVVQLWFLSVSYGLTCEPSLGFSFFPIEIETGLENSMPKVRILTDLGKVKGQVHKRTERRDLNIFVHPHSE